MPKILLAVTADRSLGIQRGFPNYLAEKGWDVHVVSSSGPAQELHRRTYPKVTYHNIQMVRAPRPLKDLVSLMRWVALLIKLRPDIISVGTPKAGLLGSLAARITRVPIRVYMLHGLRHEGLQGFKRTVYKLLERVTVASAHHVLAVSASVKDTAVAEKLGKSLRFDVVGQGSANGVDVLRYTVSDGSRMKARRSRWPNNPSLPVIGFVGRIHPDKGIKLLAEAVTHLIAQRQPGRLLVIGGSDGPQSESMKAQLIGSGFPVEFTGPVGNMEEYYPLIDILSLPTMREGFPTVVLEAAAAGIPTVATSATGIADAIIDGETGSISYTRDSFEYATKLCSLLSDPDFRIKLGETAKARVENHFATEIVWRNQYQYYQTLFESLN